MSLIKSEVEDRIREAIYANQKWTSSTAISKQVGVHRSSISRLDIDLDQLHEDAGFARPKCNPKDLRGRNRKILDRFIQDYSDYVQNKGSPASLYEYCKSKGMSNSGVSNYYRLGIDVTKVHESLGFRYKDLTLQKDVIESTLIDLIEKKQKYITRDELAKELGVSGSLISTKSIDVASINSKFGYVSKWKGFEDLVYKSLLKFLPADQIVRQHSFTGTEVSRLIFDFWIPGLQCLIEADGPGHYDESCIFYSEDVVKRDLRKDDFALSQDLYLIRIRYKPNLSQEYIDSYLEPLKAKHRAISSQAFDKKEGSETIPSGSRA